MITISKGSLKGKVTLPPSKSMSIRVLAAIFLSSRDTLLKGAWPKDGTQVCEDVQAAYRVVRSVGSQFAKEDIWPNMAPPGRDHSRRQLDCGESALALRMFAPIVALSSYIYCLRGRTTLITRPVDFVIQGLRELGCWCESLNTLPTLSIMENLKETGRWEPRDSSLSLSRPILLVQGPLRGGKYQVNAGGSSQFLSGLLMALPLAEKDSILEVEHLASQPYIDLTLNVMESFGVRATHDNYKVFHIPGRQSYRAHKIDIEGDWSGGANFIVGAAMFGDLRISPLWKDSLQADKAILEAVGKAGGSWAWGSANQLKVYKNDNLQGFSFDAQQCPDLFPPLVALAVHCKGTTTIHGIDRLFHKESNRALALLEEYSKVGADIRLEGNNMVIKGGVLPGGARISARGDNRIAMSLAIAALGAEKPIEIEGKHTVAKSFPDFWEELNNIRIPLS
ncbi:MAG TPA: 3-phosphoshikimate 1-carboxyvinyltransferase [Bacteroidales bacterium]|jgi:3-phosphoshikimate 1-carboxyvinyltransferase|nr:3-phosphoshikimate 1-carboxyvinyltransferase [Bacteroidales bacterium]MCZ2416108.1 3-phosphoshikimate 1-carboxyvinyltransferase [Burkholderiales bacterium]OQC58585.1 MAG: 3-phosphoshikimate 1-carboxyvinyltransferase [Bacteroidetes bacterium ADurb.Bin013]MBP8999355.1 3-phosphoshikimate 1-carboxyvinyltransferase [Bacteroidales bacterium]NLZ09309.1 3-phosphoshikimate 1-carboxyvinyltransferase [Bacteroidales bacterium]